MKLIVGLGNPGASYETTRHNIGYMVVDKLGKELGQQTATWSQDARHGAYIAKIGEVVLVKPTTFMNNSGLAVRQLIDFYRLAPSDVWVIHDDIDLPLGKLRIRSLGASAGHNGIDSIIKHLRTDKFIRFRLGIGRGRESTGRNTDKNIHHRSVIDFVLSRFRQGEAGEMRKLIKYGVAAVRIAITEGIDRAMNRFN